MYFTPTFFVLPLFEKAPETSKEKALTLFYTFPLWKKKKKKKTTFEKREKESRERRRFCDDDSSCAFFFSEELKRERERRLDFSALLCVQFLNDTLTRETVKRKDTIGERHISCLDSNASTPRVRLRDDIHFFFPFLLSLSSLSFLSEHKHSATVVVVYVVVYAFFFAFLFDFCYYLLGVSLSFKSHFACIETTPPPMTTRY